MIHNFCLKCLNSEFGMILKKMKSESAMKIFGFWTKPSEQRVKYPYYM